MKGFRFFVLLLFMLPMHVQAGWVLKVRHYFVDSEEEKIQLIYFQENVIKIIEDDLTTIYDLNENMLTFLKPQIQMYWKGALKDYRNEVKETLELAVNMEIEQLPDDQKEEARKMLETMIRIMENPDTLSSLDIFVRETGEIEDILGYQTRKYQVFLNGVITEDLWVATNLDVSADLNFKEYLLFVSKLRTGFENELVYHNTEEYSQIIKERYILRTKEYHTGYQTINEVIEIQEIELDNKIFLPPENYKLVSLSDLGIISTDDEE